MCVYQQQRSFFSPTEFQTIHFDSYTNSNQL
ncbi:hypothetical protein VF_A0066 [Aliivibrio fischeri ES114]|uniref:Uncharacterized protein n=1 Tax=Aliivibrio fischeri (strain ATCC 700601 / ES114) TaxID=312309 RepID=Q5E1G1_ALIF1|nr:hypothetical protein VF_A0066 [Aliivibrio fischeri ES114]